MPDETAGSSPADTTPTVDAEAVTQQAANAFGVIASSVVALTNTVGRIEGKVDRQSGRMDTLVDTTNHRLDDFREDLDMHRRDSAAAMLAFQATVTAAVAAKADRKELAPGALFWQEVHTNRALQVVTGGVVVTLAPVIYANWAGLVESVRSLFS